jgi:hypothetical protein
MENKKLPILDELNVRKNPEVPSDYFSTISGSVLSKIDKIEEPINKKSYNFKWGFIAACASIILLLSLQFNSIDDTVVPNNQNHIAQLTLNEDQEDIADFMNEFDAFEFTDIELDLEEI